MIDSGSLWSSLPVPALCIDVDNSIIGLNPMAEGFLNISERAVVKHPLADTLAVDAPLLEGIQRVRETEAPIYINDVDLGGGQRAPVQCSIQIAPFSGDQVIVLITPRELTGQLGQGHNVNGARSAIGMAEMLVHEIKNPLTGITGAAQLLSMNLGPQDSELTDLIVSESRRIVALLDQVEQFGNLAPPDLQPVNLHDVLHRARQTALLGFGARMRILESFDPSLPLALGDMDKLVQVVLNLLKNASEAAAQTGGTITLRTYYEHAFRLRRADGPGHALPLQIEVIDDGPGLPDDLRGDIFDPFVSGRENGTGLGLALVSKIIAEHGGWITATSTPGRTVFRVSLRRADEKKG